MEFEVVDPVLKALKEAGLAATDHRAPATRATPEQAEV